MRVRLTGVSALLLVAMLGWVPAAGAQFEARGLPVGKDGAITPANLDAREAWPLTIERGTFVCEDEAVFISDGKVQYPLNGVAKTMARTYPKDRRPLEDIWRRDEKVMERLKDGAAPVAVVRINITPVLERGVQWCRTR